MLGFHLFVVKSNALMKMAVSNLHVIERSVVAALGPECRAHSGLLYESSRF